MSTKDCTLQHSPALPRSWSHDFWLLLPTLFKYSLFTFVFVKQCCVLIHCQAVKLCLYLWFLISALLSHFSLPDLWHSCLLLIDPVSAWHYYILDLSAGDLIKLPAFASCSHLLPWQEGIILISCWKNDFVRKRGTKTFRWTMKGYLPLYELLGWGIDQESQFVEIDFVAWKCSRIIQNLIYWCLT